MDLARVEQRDVLAMLATAIYSMPAFLLAGASVQVRQDIGLPDAALGAGVAAYFATSAIATLIAARMMSVGLANSGVVIASAGTTIALVGMAAAPTWPVLLPCLCLAGVCNGTGQLSANQLISGHDRSAGGGLAFGLKQSGVPLAVLVSGVLVPSIAVTLSWRAVFVLGALCAAATCTVIWRAQPEGGPKLHPEGGPKLSRSGSRSHVGIGRGLILLAIGGGLGAAAADALSAFFVRSAVASGLAPSIGGLLFAAGGAFGVLARLSVGFAADHGLRRPLLLVAAMLGCGCVGFVLLALGSVLAAAVAVPLCFGLGWGWPGLLYFGAASRQWATAAATTAVVQAGTFVGAVVGPLLFGVITGVASYRVAWLVTALSAALAGVAVARGHARFANDRLNMIKINRGRSHSLSLRGRSSSRSASPGEQ
jgi:predicted MFS family arabinose efflux permease